MERARKASVASGRSSRRQLSNRSSSSTARTLYRVDTSVLSILDQPPNPNGNHEKPYLVTIQKTLLDYGWYREWLAQQVENLPACLLRIIKKGDDVAVTDFSRGSLLHSIFLSINHFVRDCPNPCIDEVVRHLQENHFLDQSAGNDTPEPEARLLVFAILGWQTMLYVPAFNICPTTYLAIHQEPDQPDSRLVYDTFRVSADLADRPFSVMLKGFGNLLPARSQGVTKVASETGRVASSWNPINVAEMNAYFLSSLANVKFRWVDTIALHLDYDKSTRTLSLFKYPSHCVATLEGTGALYAFASADSTDLDPRANFDEITEILREILLSYRLLFGQKQASRKFFVQLANSDARLLENPDPLLYELCTKKALVHPSVPQDRFIYFAHRDFTVFGERVELLEQELRGSKPKNWKGLIRDKRDTTQYWTFWLVAIFGVSSLLLSLAQVIIGVISLIKQQ